MRVPRMRTVALCNAVFADAMLDRTVLGATELFDRELEGAQFTDPDLRNANNLLEPIISMLS